MIRPVEVRDADAWAVMRGHLWPDADAASLARETRGFVEVALRQFSDGCDSMPIPHIEGWYVEPSARGNGVGRRLMSAAEIWASSLGFKEIASDTEIHNEASLRAHQACGFEEVDRLIKFRKALA
ncbi:MAG: GNAT family N-acetyltransferase [Vulcanimicrobiaceae bacterium]